MHLPARNLRLGYLYLSRPFVLILCVGWNFGNYFLVLVVCWLWLMLIIRYEIHDTPSWQDAERQMARAAGVGEGRSTVVSVKSAKPKSKEKEGHTTEAAAEGDEMMGGKKDKKKRKHGDGERQHEKKKKVKNVRG